MSNSKICTVCKIEKENTAFAFKFKSRGILLSNCRECQKNIARRHYLKNKESIKKKTKESRLKIYKMFYEYMSDKSCSSCGESDTRVLEFDHRDRETKSYTVSHMLHNGFSWESIMSEISKCDILCANCHKIRTSIQFNWGKGKTKGPIV